MKRLLLLIILFPLLTYSQETRFYEYPREGEGFIAGGFGLNWIDDELYYTFAFRPEVSFMNFGIGLDLRLDINKQGNLRTENFNETSDYLSLIRYIRYGIKNDPVYIKLGALDYHTLGHGSIMYRYNNSPTYDARKIGLAADIDFSYFGFESIYSKFGEEGVVGLRGYARPLQFTSLSMVPVLGSIEVGASYVTDLDTYSGVLEGQYDSVLDKFLIRKEVSPLTIVGADISMPLVRLPMITTRVYFDYAKIIDFGGGTALGLMTDINSMGMVTASARFERRWNGDNYIPSYFNSLYEVQKFRVDTSAAGPSFQSKVNRLKNMAAENGWFGELGINIIGLFEIIGSYQRLDKDPESGILYLGTQVAPEGMPFVLRAGYDKVRIKNEEDLFKLDDRTYLYAEVGYKPMPYMLISMVYNWTFAPVRDVNDNIVSYTPQKRVEPRISFFIPFNTN